MEKLRSLGLPPGPLYGHLKAGQTVTLPSGVQVSLSMYGCDSDSAHWCTGESVLCMAAIVTLPSGVQVSLSDV